MRDSTSSQQLYKFIILGMILVLAISSLTMFTYADSINPGVYSINSAPFGTPYKEWVTRWWQWNLGIPEERCTDKVLKEAIKDPNINQKNLHCEHPRYDITGERCAVGQNDPNVWFLTDITLPWQNVVERTCTIPAGKAILFPILSGECDYGEFNTDEDVRRCALEGNEFGTIMATIDGRTLQNLKQYRIQSDFFNIKIAENNIFGVSAGTFRAMVDGFFVFLEPLPVGEYDIHFTVSVDNPIKPGYNHYKDTKYHLIVKP